MRRRKRTQTVEKPPWDSEFYVARKDCTVMYLWVVKKRSTKEEISGGGWTEKSTAVNWLSHNWKRLLEQEIENILLVNE